ncbi:hypothetical protein LTR84_005613 [Exophiala bonariae]|uniref:Amidohydrolase-related domain-containing protein n=1 Tax=Exophiala bonariae TaxID=1690606 RepID=A0AAV9N668_9EURO|nr:hypothetical protein LTR84_005613 [Exophiala bonariae]
MKLNNIILLDRDPKSRWTVEYNANTIDSILPSTDGELRSGPSSPEPSEETNTGGEPASLLLPALSHPHIHLDKPYLLTTNIQHHPTHAHQTSYPDYTDLTPKTGSFSEALSFTGQAKARYTPADLYLRGSQLIATSLTQGVTSCRAFVELDHVTGTTCLEAAVQLKESFGGKFELQICAFAQDPVFSSDHGEENRRILEDTLLNYAGAVEAVGSTPYVESDREAGLQNIKWAIEMALQHDLHLDFHLDYNLGDSEPMVWDVIRLLNEAEWTSKTKPGKTIVLGHCSRLTMFTNKEMKELATQIHDSGLPIHFLGLPTSDLFMMGRPDDDGEESKGAYRPRGTLQIPSMIRDYGLNGCLGVNNVGNAFTPWGTGDPLALASLGVGIYQAGTSDDAKVLLECVSQGARRAIGLETGGAEERESSGDLLWEGRKGDLLLIKNNEWIGCPGHLGLKVPARQRISVKDVVWDPPEIRLRTVLK